jgi:F-type H+-transporting ATPase subunit a
MSEAPKLASELPNLVTLLARKLPDSPFIQYLYLWENVIYSLIIVAIILLITFWSGRRHKLIPDRLQNFLEVCVGGIDDFVCGILGPKGRKYTPFIGTLFIYIVLMNLFGVIPFMKSSTSSWSTTLALALCVFIYVQYAAVRERGFLGYIDHLMGSPRGIIAFSVFIPLLTLFMHIIAELVRPISLSLRLRSNVWGDDLLLAIIAGFGLKGLPMLLLNTFLVIFAGLVQALVFCLLTTIYFALAITEEEVEIKKGGA